MFNQDPLSNEESGSISTQQIISFAIGSEEYALPILNVQEIKRLSPITRVPQTSGYIKGVMNLRGSVLPVIDLCQRMGLQHQPATEKTRIIIVNAGDITLGMIVDEVNGVLTMQAQDLAASKNLAGMQSAFVKNVGRIEERLISILDVRSIMDDTQ